MSAYDPAVVQTTLERLHAPGDVFEVRILRTGRDGTVSGYLDDPAEASTAIAPYDGEVPGVYATLNPVDPSLLARAENRLRTHASDTTRDRDVVRRRWLLIDVDYRRPAGMSATDEEVDAAIAVARRAKVHLEDERGWSAGIMVHSGNGAHLLYRIDLPNDDSSRNLVKRVLTALATRFDDGDVHVDTSVYNAARIVKVPGTMACKGEDLPERPHRRSHILDQPEVLTPVPSALLEALAGPVMGAPTSATGNAAGPRFDLEGFIERNGLKIRKTKQNADGDLYELDTCPFNPEHDRGEAFLMQLPNDALSAGCLHESCTWGWADLREKYEPSAGDSSLDDDGHVKAELARLAALDTLAYERERKEAAETLGFRVTILDSLVEALRKTEQPGSGNLFLEDPEPWPDPVGGAELLDELCAAARRYVSLPAGAAEAIALWCLHAHAHDAAEVSPILGLTSPILGCGKTTLMTLLAGMVPRPLPASNITAAAVFRAVEKYRPSLMIDEADTFLRDNDELRGVLNSGHARAGAYVVRTGGDTHEPAVFHTWAPKAIALIGRLPATLASRSIHIELKRLAPDEQVEPLRLHKLGDLLHLRRKAARWAADHLEELREHDPDMPPELKGRAADNWRSLLSIADIAGGEWPQLARQAAVALSADTSEQTAGIMVLEDLRKLFEERGDRLPTADILETLNAMEDRPWPEWNRGRELSPSGLARLLLPFGIRPRTIRPGGGSTPKGYLKEQFEDAFVRYLPGPGAATPPQPASETEEAPSPAATPQGPVAAGQDREPASRTECGGVAAAGPPTTSIDAVPPATTGGLSMTAREIIEDCEHRSIKVFCISDFEVRLFPYSDDDPPVPDWLESAARERALEIIDYVRFKGAAKELKTDAERRLRSICPSKTLRKSPQWQGYEGRMREADQAEDLERLTDLLTDREQYVIAIFGDKREERRRKRYEDKYGG